MTNSLQCSQEWIFEAAAFFNFIFFFISVNYQAIFGVSCHMTLEGSHDNAWSYVFVCFLVNWLVFPSSGESVWDLRVSGKRKRGVTTPQVHSNIQLVIVCIRHITSAISPFLLSPFMQYMLIEDLLHYRLQYTCWVLASRKCIAYVSMSP